MSNIVTERMLDRYAKLAARRIMAYHTGLLTPFTIPTPWVEYERKREDADFKIEQMLDTMGVKEVIFNDDRIIVNLEDGSKGVAKCSRGDHFDPAVGFAMAYAVAVATRGNKSEFKRNIDRMYGGK